MQPTQLRLLPENDADAPETAEPQTRPEKREFMLIGLDGGNPLGFLAAVGTLKAASEALPESGWRMRWRREAGQWSPALEGITALDQEQLIKKLAEHLKNADHQALSISKNLNLTPDQFRACAQEAQDRAELANRRFADFIAAFGSETATSNKGQQISDTAIRTMSGSGHQNFLETMLQTITATTANHLRHSLFAPWLREDQKLGLRWDPLEDRRYALRWSDPSETASNTERGANRLAIEALPLLPTSVNAVNKETTLETTGFRREAKGFSLTWPIWICPIDINATASAIRLQEIQKEAPNPIHLEQMGIAAVYRSRRVTVGKFRNFTPAAPV